LPNFRLESQVELQRDFGEQSLRQRIRIGFVALVQDEIIPNRRGLLLDWQDQTGRLVSAAASSDSGDAFESRGACRDLCLVREQATGAVWLGSQLQAACGERAAF